MAYRNSVQLIGNLGDDPEMHTTQGGTAVTNFRMATNFKWTDRNGEQREQIEWHRIVCWRGLAEACYEYLRKGSGVHVEGRLQTRKWEDRDGITRYTTEIVANDVQFLSNYGRRDDSGYQEADDDIGGEQLNPEDMPF